MNPYYFDYNATTPLDPDAFEAMRPYLEGVFGNPSSHHQMGQAALRALKEARKKTASFLGALEDSEIIFTSGATESNNAALRAALKAQPHRKVIVTSAVEHSSIRKLCAELVKEGYTLREIGVDDQGRLSSQELEAALDDQVAIVTLMWANNETGVIFPVDQIAAKVKSKGILFHVDAVQAAGKIPLFLRDISIDYLSLSAHKFYGPKGVGILYVRKGSPFTSLISGGSQERGRRAGTENVPGIVGLGVACEKIQNKLQEESLRLKSLRTLFEKQIKIQIPEIQISGEETDRLVNTSHLRILGVESEAVLIALDQKGIFASSGSACMSGSQEPSHVLKAMGCSEEEAKGALRFSFGAFTHETSIHLLIHELREIVLRIRAFSKNQVLVRE